MAPFKDPDFGDGQNTDPQSIDYPKMDYLKKILLAQSFSNSRNDLQDVTAVTHDLLACFVWKIMSQKQLVV